MPTILSTQVFHSHSNANEHKHTPVQTRTFKHKHARTHTLTHTLTGVNAFAVTDLAQAHAGQIRAGSFNWREVSVWVHSLFFPHSPYSLRSSLADAPREKPHWKTVIVGATHLQSLSRPAHTALITPPCSPPHHHNSSLPACLPYSCGSLGWNSTACRILLSMGSR